MRLIGLLCKHGDMFSLQVLIGRGLFLLFVLFHFCFSCCSIFKVSLVSIVGVYGDEVPPVPIPNTEVKLICVENTWLVTTWEDKSTPAQNSAELLLCTLYSSIAQSVEHLTVNQGVTGSSPVGGVKSLDDF